MKAWIVAIAMTVVALAAPAFGQAVGTRSGRAPAASAGATTDTNAGSAPAPKDSKVYKSGAVLPGPTPAASIEPPTVPLPDLPLEPYLLTKQAGPFMVLAQTFRGPDAPRMALALTLELRNEFGLPAWIFLNKNQPMHSNIFGVPPTAPPYVDKPELAMPEKVRIYDEAAVLVGNCKTLDESEALWTKVKHIHPKCLENMSSILPWRKGQGLSRAMRCWNPYIPAQYLYPKKPDPLIAQMNAGPMSVLNCPGRYTLQVGEFTGRSSFDPKDRRIMGAGSLAKSPLMEAADNAQKMADALAKDPDIVRTGYKPYVYHDRYCSKVTMGAFNAPNDPAAAALRTLLLKKPLDLKAKVPVMIVPASELIDLQSLPTHESTSRASK